MTTTPVLKPKSNTQTAEPTTERTAEGQVKFLMGWVIEQGIKQGKVTPQGEKQGH